ncbi:MAG: 4-alpha-glucanotransferase, partial [Bacteroidota bacterium]
MLLNFYLRFSTRFGQSLFVYGSHAALGDNDIAKAVPLQYFNEEFWYAHVEIENAAAENIDVEYRYILKEDNNNEIVEWGNDRIIDLPKLHSKEEVVLMDTWNHAGEIENAFFTKPFNEVLLRSKEVVDKPKEVKTFTHEFKVKAPMLAADEAICIAGTAKTLGDWKTETPILLNKSDNWWDIKLNFGKDSLPIAYKYGVYNTATKKFIQFEQGKNRTLQVDTNKNKSTIIHDGFANIPYSNWKGAGVAIPVFSLRTANSYGTGEFTDIKELVDWSKQVGLKLIQLL